MRKAKVIPKPRAKVRHKTEIIKDLLDARKHIEWATTLIRTQQQEIDRLMLQNKQLIDTVSTLARKVEG